MTSMSCCFLSIYILFTTRQIQNKQPKFSSIYCNAPHITINSKTILKNIKKHTQSGIFHILIRVFQVSSHIAHAVSGVL